MPQPRNPRTLVLLPLLLVSAACAGGGPEGAGPPEPAEPAASEVDPADLESSARGTFEVELEPAWSDEEPEGSTLGRFRMTKRFDGDLRGTSAGEMLSARTPDPGSAGYVAIERVDGTLGGRRGTFVLQHSGTMSGGEQTLSVTVVPGSGTGGLAGLRGRMQITVTPEEHSYVLEYALPGPEPAGDGT